MTSTLDSEIPAADDSVGFSMYVVDCSTKCALVVLIMHTSGESGKPRPGPTCRAHE